MRWANGDPQMHVRKNNIDLELEPSTEKSDCVNWMVNQIFTIGT